MAEWRMLPGATFGFTLAGTPAERFHVQRFDGTERISQLYRYEIDVVDSDEAPVLADLLDGNAALTIDPQKSAEIVHVGSRRIGGLIAEAQLLGRREDGFQLRLGEARVAGGLKDGAASGHQHAAAIHFDGPSFEHG